MQARRVLAELGAEPVADPLTALMKLAGQVLGWQEATAALVNELEAVRYRGANGAEQLRAEVGLYERAMDRAVVVLAAIARLNIEERLAKVTEQQARTMVVAVNAALVAAGLSSDQRVLVQREIARELRLVSADGREAAGS